jgi:hypothetical protein
MKEKRFITLYYRRLAAQFLPSFVSIVNCACRGSYVGYERRLPDSGFENVDAALPVDEIEKAAVIDRDVIR